MRPTNAIAEVGDLSQRFVAQDRAKAFARWVQALAAAGGDVAQAKHIVETRWPGVKHLEPITKAAVDVGTTDGWGEALSPTRALGAAFLGFVRPRTVLGRLLGVQSVPFNVSFAVQDGGFGAGWAGQGKPVIVSKGSFDRIEFKDSKIAGIAVLTQELVRSSDPAAERVVERDLAAAVIEFSDTQLLDPTVAEVPDVSPASITNGATEITSTGTTAALIETDLSAMVAALVTGGVSFAAPYWVMKPSTALYLAKLRGTGGARIFPDVGPLGGSIWTIPVITSVSAGDQITLLDAAEIMVADDGLDVMASTQGALQMSDTPDDPGTTGTVLVSLWQTNCVALKAIRYIRWKRRRDEAVVWMTVAY